MVVWEEVEQFRAFHLGVRPYHLNLILHPVELKEHRFDLNVVVLPQMGYVTLELADFLVLPLLPFDENDRMIEALLQQVVLIVFPQDLNLAPKIIVGTFDQLELTGLPVPLQILALNPVPTLVVALAHFPETPFVVCLQILVHDYCLASRVLAL